MAKFCGNCGSKLNGGEPFCSQCGYRIEDAPLQPEASQNMPQYGPPSSPRPQPAYAPPRPAPTPSYAAPQPTPAAAPPPPSAAPAPAVTHTAPPAPQKAAPPSYADFSRAANQSGQQQSSNSPRKKGGCGKCFLIMILSGLVFVLLSVGAVWFFGFLDGFLNDDPPENNPRGRIADSSKKKPSKQEKKPGLPARRSKAPSAASKADYGFPYAASVSSIKVRYSEKDIKNAPKREAAVSPQSCQAECGEIKADFRSWNLQGEDTFIVRTLPELKDKEAGYVIKGYDFAMASGQNEFATDVTLTIPRTAQGENEGFCVAFNDKTGQWERVYSEISEDGKSYTIYTDHFCGKGEALPTNELARQIAKEVTSEDLEKKQVKDYFGIFCYYEDSKKYHRMTSPVFAYYSYLWGVFQDKYAYTINDIILAINRNPQDKVIYADPDPTLTFGCEAVDVTGTASDLLGFTPDHPFFKGPSAVTTLIGWISTASKMKSEIKQGKKLGDAAWNNKLNIVSGSVGTVGLFVSNPPVATGLTIAGVAVYCISKIDEATAPRELSVPEQIYRDYFYREYGAADNIGRIQRNNANKQFNRAFGGHPESVVPGASAPKKDSFESARPKQTLVRHFYYDLSSGDERLSRPDAANIKRIPGLTDKENSHLKNYINKGGLAGSDPRQKSEIPAEWAYTLKILYKICEDHPERLSKLILDFYTNYAKTCWEMGDQKYKEFMEAVIEDRNYTENALRPPTPNQKDDYTKNMVTEMMGSHSELIYELTTSAEHKSRQEIENLIEKDLLPKLNTMVEFRVTDDTLENPKDFSKSVYGERYAVGKDNPGLYGKYAVDWSKAETPMAFGIKKGGDYQPVSKPRFIPRKNLGGIGRYITKGNEEDYFPYIPNFLPQAVSGDNLVFTCTYYHYLMMGAPSAIIFHKMGEKDDYKPVPFILPQAPDSDGIMRVNVQAPKSTKKNIYVFDHCEDEENIYGKDYFWTCILDKLKNQPLIEKDDGSFSLSANGTYKIDRSYYDENYESDAKDSGVIELRSLSVNGRFGPMPKDKEYNDITTYNEIGFFTAKIKLKEKWRKEANVMHTANKSGYCHATVTRDIDYDLYTPEHKVNTVSVKYKEGMFKAQDYDELVRVELQLDGTVNGKQTAMWEDPDSKKITEAVRPSALLDGSKRYDNKKQGRSLTLFYRRK